MRKRGDQLMRVWIAQVGAPFWFTSRFTDRASVYFDYYADLAERHSFEETRDVAHGRAKVIREPVGVCALITPWNSPLILLAQKLAPALLAGCTVVAKPSPETPLDALILAECLQAAGLPEGVVNIVPGGREAGDWLVRQPQIDKVGFTGSTAAGKHIAKICADRLARVSLELGGKSASIICDDADLSSWLKSVAPFTMPFSGQICFAQARVLVSKKRHDEVLDAFASAAKEMTIGDPWDPATQIGPLSMARQHDRVLDYIETGKREGARLVTGGGGAPGVNKGYFVAPTIFDQVTREMTIAREEIFGPVVSVMTYDDEEEAVEIANDSDYGLSGTVFAADVDRAEAIARRVRTGNISVNGLHLDPNGPFGGFKQSGIGREGGPEGLSPYLETKTLYLCPSPRGRKIKSAPRANK
jgi:acyl-CoA reductase-like NAD-dependent aldehyde dehydrogenase